MATTNYSVNNPLARKVWSARLFREALKETFISRFMGESKDSLVYVKNDLNKGAGDQITYGLRMQLAGAGVLGDNTLEGNEEALTTYSDKITIDQLRHAVRSAGEMSEQRVPFSVRAEAKDGLRDWWAERIDTAFFNQIGGNVTNAAAEYTGNNTVTAPSASHRLVGCNNGVGGASVTASLTFTNTASASSRGVSFQLKVVDICVNKAKILSPMIRPLRINGQSKYVMFLHPNQVRQLKTDASAATITWYDIMRARAEGGDVESNPIYNGALGEYNSVIFHESSRVPLIADATAGSVRSAIFCGAQAACFATGKRDSDSQMKWVEEYFDFENQLGVSAGMIWGLKKTVFNSLDFGTITVMTGSPDPA